MKNRDIASAVIESVEYPNKGRFSVPETGQAGIVKNTIPGQKVLFRVFKNKHHRVEGHLLEVLERSPLETRKSVCSNFGRCGGCLYQTLPYETQLALKEEQIKKLLQPVLEADSIYDGIKGSPVEMPYRNKMDFSFGNETVDGPLTVGMHRMRARYTVLDAESCRLAHSDLTMISSCIRDYGREKALPFYNKLSHTGYLRYLMLRRSETTGEILVALATSTQLTHDYSELVSRLLSLPLKGKIAGIFHVLDDRYGDALIPDETICLYGKDYFYEQLFELRFRVTLYSFFQTNTKGAEVLYGQVRAYMRLWAGKESLPYGAGPDSSERKKPVLYDLYCGTGTIGQILSQEASRVYGVELIEDAVRAAEKNAALNGLTNCVFLAGDVGEVLPAIPEKPDYLVLDPPREGIHPDVVRQIIFYGVPELIYISCKATSFVRDMQYLKEGGYRIRRWALIDMFPETQHVETIVLLQRQNS